MPVRQLSSNLLKRVRSASPAPELRSPATTETTDQFALKVSKHQLNASPRSSALQQQQRVVSIMTSSQRLNLHPLNVQEPSQMVSWPHVTSCDGVRNAITFLQTSRQHAMMLMLQNHWERAVGVLEKIEKATESVCLQRRKVVLEQVNAAKINASAIAPVRRSAVRFSDHVHVAAAVDMDRACDELDAPVREEMLVLRASRTIPQENYSEFCSNTCFLNARGPQPASCGLDPLQTGQVVAESVDGIKPAAHMVSVHSLAVTLSDFDEDEQAQDVTQRRHTTSQEHCSTPVLCPMLSDAALYQSASHPEKSRLVFNTQLHQALKSVAKNREIVSVTPNATNTARPVLSLHDPYGSGSSFGRSTELNGWDLEKKMVALQEVRDLLARPFFFYSDWATQAAAAAKNAPASLEKRMNYYSYFGKTLPLELGQSTLLDLWDYLMDMCEYVPVRNRCRSLYLHVAACICRRVEFIESYDIDGEKIHLSEQVNQRYHKLLERCMQFCATKLNKSRFLADDHKLFIAHIYAAAYFRFPFTTSRLLTAILDTTAVLERVDNDDDDNNNTNGALENTPPTSPKAGITISKRPHRKSTLRGYRSPRGHCRNWNTLSGNEESARSSNRALEELKRGTFASFERYKTSRSTDDLLSEKEASSFRKGARSVDASLEYAFQQMMAETTEQQETQFFDHLPLLYIGNAIESAAFSSPAFRMPKDALENALEPFLDRLITPGRDDLIGVTFVTAFLSDISSWCSHRKEWTMATTPWHCIPGYFAVIRLFVAVFRLMCQRRPRMAAMPAPANSVGRILSIVEGSQSSTTSNPWLSYWTAREAEVVLDAAAEVLKNEYLVNVLVKIVLETTNMHDPVSVNYSFGILQRVLEIAAKAATTSSSSSSKHTNSEGKPTKTRTPHRLSAKFDDTYFLVVMRRALQSSHVQILLKVLTCLYNSIDLFPARVRKRIIGELILRENFFRFFMHWNEEVRKIYCYIVVFKTSTSNRLDLPCASDRIMLAHSPYFEATTNGSSSSSSSLSPASAAASTSSSPSSASGYWTQLSDMAHAMLRANGLSALGDAETKKNNAIGANALKRLLVWDASARLRKHRGSAHTTLFRDAMVDDELSVDLSIASKLDALFKMIAEQMEKANRTLKQKSAASSSEKSESGAHSYFPKELEAYIERGLSQYVTVLWEYYESAFETPNSTLPPLSPTLQFTITMPVFTD